MQITRQRCRGTASLGSVIRQEAQQQKIKKKIILDLIFVYLGNVLIVLQNSIHPRSKYVLKITKFKKISISIH